MLGIVKKPQPIPWFRNSNIKVKQIAVGARFSLVLTADNKLYSFGDNSGAQLGRTPSQENDSVPGLVDLQNLQTGEQIIQIHCSGSVGMLLTDKNKLYAWGMCMDSQCPGYDQFKKLESPTLIIIDQKVTWFQIETDNLWIMDDSRDLWSFGSNVKGKLCTGSSNSVQSSFVKTKFNGIQKLSIGASHTIILQNGVVEGCGKGNFGELGEATTNENNNQPIIISQNFNKVIDVAATYMGTLLMTENQIFSSGTQLNGELTQDVKTVKQFLIVQSEAPLENVKMLHASSVSVFILTKIEVEEEEKEEGESESEEGGQEEEQTKPNNQLSTGQIAGIAVGVVLFIILVSLVTYFLVKRKKQKLVQKEEIVVSKEQPMWFNSQLIAEGAID